MGKPSFPFYPDDWMNDLGLRGCSPATRGIWADLLCLMHQGTPYGFLTDKAGPLSMRFVAVRCGVSLRQFGIALAELEQHEVFSRDEHGTIWSRRMVRDEKTRIARGQGGSASAANPAVPRSKGIHKGILPSTKVVPSFDPEEVKEEVVLVVLKKNKDPSEKNAQYDPMPGWMTFKLGYPPHRINEFMDLQIWISVVDSYETEALILTKLPRFKQSATWKDQGGKFVPKASKFLGEREFMMEPGPEFDAIGPTRKSLAQQKMEAIDQL